MRHLDRPGRTLLVVVALGSVWLSGCETQASPEGDEPPAGAPGDVAVDEPGEKRAAGEATPPTGPRTLTLAFAGDVHFEGGQVGVPARPRSTLGPMSAALRGADLAMVNLESSLTGRGREARKELEVASNRYWFRSPPSALDLLDRSGVDVVTLANNHGADYGVAGVRDTVRLAEQSPVAVVGVGLDAEQAFAPHRVSIRGTDVAVHAADSSMRESADPTWAARPGSGPGLAAARVPNTRQLVNAVRRSARVDDLVVVYLHWGEENNPCATGAQRTLAKSLTDAGADIVVGTHAHVPLGAGMRGDTYVSYGLGNFYWYHGRQPDTGVLRLRVRDGEVVDDTWFAGRIPPDGGAPQALTGAARAAAVTDWRRLRGCTDLAPGPGARPPAPAAPPEEAPETSPVPATTVRRIGPALRVRMRSSHDPATCPVPLSALRHLAMPFVGFDGRTYRGQMVVHADVARDVVGVFAALYRARFPIQQMRLVDAFGGDDNRSMAANNTSGYNCRTVAGTDSFSDHASGRAVDINPVQNPYVLGEEILPPAGRRFVAVDRSAGARTRPGVIRRGDVVTRAFDRLGWEWGGDYADPDFQHFSAP